MEKIARFLEEIQFPDRYPAPTDDILDDLEDFMTFSLDAELASVTDNLISYLCHFIAVFEDLHDDADLKMHVRLMKVLQMVRPNLMSADQSARIQGVFLNTLYKYTDVRRSVGFTLFLKHAASAPKVNREKPKEVAIFLAQFLKGSVENFPNVDFGFIRLVCQSFRSLLAVLDMPDMVVVPQFSDELVRLVALCLRLSDREDFFPNIAIVVSKGLRLLSRLFEYSSLDVKQPLGLVTAQTVKVLGQMQKDIPDDARMCHIYENYLLCVYFSLRLDEQKRDVSLADGFLRTMERVFPLLSERPFNKSRRIVLLTSKFASIYGMGKKTLEYYKRLSGLVWPLLGNLHRGGQNVAYSLISAFVSDELFRENPLMMSVICQELCAGLRVMENDFMAQITSDSKGLDVDLWLDFNREYMMIVSFLLKTYYSDKNARTDPVILSLITGVIDYFAFVFDEFGLVSHCKPGTSQVADAMLAKCSQKEFSDKMIHALKWFSSIFGNIPAQVARTLLYQSLYKLMPTETHHVYHKHIHQYLLRDLSDQTAYFAAFFWTIASRFEALFLPEPKPALIELTRQISQEAFFNESKQTPQQAFPPQIANEFFAFMLKGFASKNAAIITNLVAILQLVARMTRQPSQKIGPFLERIRSCSFGMYPVMKVLSEEPKLSDLIALLSLPMAMLCDNDHKDASWYESWIIMFLPALEGEHAASAARSLYTYVVRDFSAWIKRLKKPIQMRLVTSLASTITSLTGQDVMWARSLLNKIPDLTLASCSAIQEPKNVHMIVRINDLDVDFDICFDSIKKQDAINAEDEAVLRAGYAHILNALPFQLAVTDKKIHALAQFIGEKCPSVFLDLISASSGPKIEQVHGHLFFLHKYGPKDKLELSSYIDNAQEFIMELCLVANNRYCASTVVAIIGELLTNSVELSSVYQNVLTALLQASVYDFAKAKQVVADHLLLTDGDTEQNVGIVKGLYAVFGGGLFAIHRPMRKLSLYGVKFYTERYPNICPSAYARIKVGELPRRIIEERKVNACADASRYEFVMISSLGDVPDKVSLVEGLLDVLKSLPLVNLPKDIQKLCKNHMHWDDSLAAWSTFKFTLKLIIKCLMLCPQGAPVNNLWERLLVLLRQEFRTMLPYLMKYTEKELKERSESIVPSLPTEPLNVFAPPTRTIPAPTCTMEDVMVFRYLYKFSLIRPTTEVMQWVSLVLKKTYEQQQKVPLAELMRFIVDIFKKCENTPSLEDIVLQAVRVCMLPQASSLMSVSPLQILAQEMPEMVLKMLCICISTSWSANNILALCRLLVDSNLVQFRELTIERCLDSFGALMEYLKNLQPFQFEFSLSQVMLAIGEIMKSASSEVIDLDKLVDLIVRFLVFARDQFGASIHRPSVLFGITEVLIPVQFADQFVKGSSILDSFTSKALPAIIDSPRLFHSPIFLKKFSVFLQKVEKDARDYIFEFIESYQTSDPFQMAFLFDLIGERSRFLDSVSVSHDVGFRSFPKSGMFADARLAYYGMRMGLHSNIEIRDAADCDLCLASPQHCAPAIASGCLDFSSCVTLTQMLHVCEILQSEEWYAVDRQRSTAAIMGHANDVTTPLRYCAFILRSQSRFLDFFDLSNRDVVRYILRTMTTLLYAQVPSPERAIAMIAMPELFQELAKTSPESIDRMFEICLFLCSYLLRKPRDSSACEKLHLVIETFLPLIDRSKCNRSLINGIRELVKSEPPNAQVPQEQQMLEIMMAKLALKILPALAPLIFVGNSGLPRVLHLQNETVIKVVQSRDYVPFFQKLVQEIGRYCGLEMQQLVVKQMYELLKCRFENFPGPLMTPFATVAQWLNEKPTDSKELKFVLSVLPIFLEAVKPVTRNHLILTLKTLRFPVHHSASAILEKLLNNEFVDIRDSPRLRSFTCAFAIPVCQDVVQCCWAFDWFSTPESQHVRVLLRMMSPSCIQHHISRLNETDSMQLLAALARNFAQMHGFDQFLRFYSAFWPNSPASECLMVLPELTHGYSGSCNFTKVVEDLHTHSFTDDALGLLKHHVPSLSYAIGYHQISNYRAAKAYYLRAMNDHPNEAYFHGLCQLRRVSINLSLPMTQNLYDMMVRIRKENTHPEIRLPFLDDVRRSGTETLLSYREAPKVTSFFSSVYLPDLMRACLVDEIIASLRAMQRGNPRNPSQVTDVIRQFSIFPMGTLDKLDSMSSLIAWRLTLVRKLHELEQTQISLVMLPGQHNPSQADSYNDVARSNRAAFARFLMKCGDSYQALKQYSSLGGTAEQDSRHFPVTTQSLPRILQFIKRASMEHREVGVSLRQRTYMKLRFCLAEFTKYIQEPSARLTRLWLTTLISVESISTSLIDPQSIFQRISKEMSMATADKVRCYLEMCLYLTRRNPKLTDMFMAKVLEQAKGEISEMFRWLPTIITTCGKVPDKFMLLLARHSPTDVILMAKHAQYSGTQNIQAAIDEFLERLAMVKDMPRAISAYNRTFKWLSQCQDDIRALKNIIEAHVNFYEAAAATDVNPSNLRELAQVCGQYRPVLNTTATRPFQTNMELTGVKFYMMGKSVAQMTVRSNDVDEAQILVTASNGEISSYALVSPLLYHFSLSEMFFVQAVQKMMQSHPSYCERSRCLTYPQAILLDPDLLMVFLNAIFSQQTLCSPMLPSLFAEARLATDECSSPVGVREKRRIDVDRGFYAKKVTEFAAGRKLEFLQARSCLASHLAAYSVIHFIFGASLPIMPSLCLPKHPLRLTIPGFFKFLDKGPLLPITPAISEMLPLYLLKGTFTTTWHVVADAIGRHPEKMKITIAALAPRDVSLEKCMEFLARAKKLSVQVATETEKLDEPFPFILLDHLIDTAANTMEACESAYSWI